MKLNFEIGLKIPPVYLQDCHAPFSDIFNWEWPKIILFPCYSKYLTDFNWLQITLIAHLPMDMPLPSIGFAHSFYSPKYVELPICFSPFMLPHLHPLTLLLYSYLCLFWFLQPGRAISCFEFNNLPHPPLSWRTMRLTKKKDQEATVSCVSVRNPNYFVSI